MKINIKNGLKLIKAKNIAIGECFKYWPNQISSPSQYHICIRTNGKFCVEDCKSAWPIRFVDLKNGDEYGTSADTMVEELSLQIGEN
jgi:hypothetical protein